MNKINTGLLLGILSLVSVNSVATELLKMGSLAPGLSPFTINTAFAKVVNDNVDGIEIQVSATGSGMSHVLKTAQNRMDFAISSPAGNWMMIHKEGPFKTIEDAPELEKNLGHILSYSLGPEHFVVFDDSGIESLDDIKGRNVFIGPPAGSATRTAERMIEMQTGYKAGVDYKAVAMSWGAALDAFQDGKIDMLAAPANVPGPGFQQIALMHDIRLLSLDASKVKDDFFSTPGFKLTTIPAGAYGDKQANAEAVTTYEAWVGIGTRMTMPEETVYKITKAFWENVDSIRSQAKWLENTLTLQNATSVIPSRLHPGALKYYREIGIEPEAPLDFRQ
ncbi:TRAP ABC transporter [Marinobacterium nitratireducens]|uniref:TRAP ABC transporter n=1 Tax=Marinobacterium nitratireducens TaxID=518897 RepID=A0A917ZKD2_9GAMM|nr:TAXI family TRAP transporter solute-binding subunit [Marinobacterium nitratireducens]GGO85378.1 TRAP ABC transporter [Marinobacterium nitratireducens]